jgi:hypothetical protein
VAVTTIGDEKGNKSPDTLDVGTIDYRATVSCPAHEPGSSENAQVRRQSIVWASDLIRERASGKATGFRPHENAKDLKPCRLPKCRKRRKRMRRGHLVPVLLRSNVTDDC